MGAAEMGNSKNSLRTLNKALTRPECRATRASTAPRQNAARIDEETLEGGISRPGKRRPAGFRGPARRRHQVWGHPMLLIHASQAAQALRTGCACGRSAPAAHAAVKGQALSHAPAAPLGAGLAKWGASPSPPGSRGKRPGAGPTCHGTSRASQRGGRMDQR